MTRNRLCLRLLFAAAFAAAPFAAILATKEQKPSPGLVKSPDGKTYEHEASKTAFQLPEGWTLILPKDKDGKELPPDTIGQVSFLSLRKMVKAARPGEGDVTYDVTVSWSPLGPGITMDVAKDLELKLLRQLYGEFILDADGKPKTDAQGKPIKKVEDAVADKPGERAGFIIAIHDGPTRDGKEQGLIYLFDYGADNDHWKIKIRATFPARAADKARQEIKEFAKHLTFK